MQETKRVFRANGQRGVLAARHASPASKREHEPRCVQRLGPAAPHAWLQQNPKCATKSHATKLLCTAKQDRAPFAPRQNTHPRLAKAPRTQSVRIFTNVWPSRLNIFWPMQHQPPIGSAATCLRLARLDSMKTVLQPPFLTGYALRFEFVSTTASLSQWVRQTPAIEFAFLLPTAPPTHTNHGRPHPPLGESVPISPSATLRSSTNLALQPQPPTETAPISLSAAAINSSSHQRHWLLIEPAGKYLQTVLQGNTSREMQLPPRIACVRPAIARATPTAHIISKGPWVFRRPVILGEFLFVTWMCMLVFMWWRANWGVYVCVCIVMAKHICYIYIFVFVLVFNRRSLPPKNCLEPKCTCASATLGMPEMVSSASATLMAMVGFSLLLHVWHFLSSSLFYQFFFLFFPP